MYAHSHVAKRAGIHKKYYMRNYLLCSKAGTPAFLEEQTICMLFRERAYNVRLEKRGPRSSLVTRATHNPLEKLWRATQIAFICIGVPTFLGGEAAEVRSILVARLQKSPGKFREAAPFCECSPTLYRAGLQKSPG